MRMLSAHCGLRIQEPPLNSDVSFRAAARNLIRLINQRTTKSNQHLPCLLQELMNPFLDLRCDHRLRPPAMGAGQSRCGPEQAADQRPFPIDLAPGVSQVRTTQRRQRRLVHCLALDRQPSHLFAGGRHRPAAVMTAGNAFEGGNALAKKADFLVVSGHRSLLCWKSQGGN